MKKNIIEEILNDPKLKELNQLEQARYVYIQLGKHFVYDTNYYTCPKIMKKQIYTREAKDIRDKAVCTSASKVYAYILNELGINAEVIGYDPNNLTHSYTIFEIDGKRYATDLIEDMNLIKVGLKTKKFMKNRYKCNYSEITDEEIQQIDEKIGYIENGIYPMEEYRLKIRREMSIIFDGDEENTNDEKEKIELEHIKSELGGDKGISEIRKKFGVRDNMTAEEIFILKMHYMIEKMGFDNLDSITKEVFLNEFAHVALKQKDWDTIDEKEVVVKEVEGQEVEEQEVERQEVEEQEVEGQEVEEQEVEGQEVKKEKIKAITAITCIGKSKEFVKFLVVEFKSGNRMIYQLAKGQPIQAITQEEIAKKFHNGMKTLSTTKRQKQMEILVGEEYSKNEEIELDNPFSKSGIFEQILTGDTTISKLNDITRDTKRSVTEQIRTSEKTDEEVSLPDLK